MTDTADLYVATAESSEALEEITKILGIQNQTRYRITYGAGEKQCRCEFSARMVESDDELADLLEVFVAHLRADKTEATTDANGVF